MGNTILQSFLDNQFLKTDDPEHIENLKKASVALQRFLENKKNKPKIISYTLVALDPTIPDDEPIVGEVEALIIKQWPAFRNSVVKTKDKQITYIQAVILEALSKLSKDEKSAAIVWHTGCNIVSHYKLAGQEEVLTNFLMEIGKKVEEIAHNDWSIHENAQIEAVDPAKISLPDISLGKVKEDNLRTHLFAAAAQQSVQGENPQWASNNAAIWPTFFSERAAKGLSEEINSALITKTKSIDSSLTNLKQYLTQIFSAILQNSQSLKKRNELLWWKQALYSPRLNLGYRTLDPVILAVVMAIDLTDNVSPIYPKSVDFFLEETLRDVLGAEVDKKIELAEILKTLKQFSEVIERILENLCVENENRKSFGACMVEILKGQMNVDEFFNHTGIEKNAKISLGELAVWMCHDLQANKLAKSN
ncbi:MAG: hypothetical protein OEZ22_14120 [Spirochaetia bacterium]|nr:hypothetical protein [Spirochaetia bacterium]